ncbi:ferrous iron transport protein A [bacterium]|nr:ferrous iron transport protein A [bacterium]
MLGAFTVSQVIPLEMLKSGEQGAIYDVDGAADLVHRLAEMGLREGVRVRMLRPGSPCILDINHQKLSFRVDDQATILVEVAS